MAVTKQRPPYIAYYLVQMLLIKPSALPQQQLRKQL